MSKISRNLVRKSDKKSIGTLEIIRTDLTKLHDSNGRRMVNPEKVDSLIIALTNPAGEQVFWESVPLSELSGE